MTPHLKQKTVLITGGSTGIGAAFAAESEGIRPLIPR
jgi:short-subunit dehydrogenase involved in D-alanine esterification of teichoic acids